MYNKLRYIVLFMSVTAFSLYPALAQEFISCDSGTSNGIRIELATEMPADQPGFLHVVGMFDVFHEIIFVPQVTLDGECIERINADEFTLALPFTDDLIVPIDSNPLHIGTTVYGDIDLTIGNTDIGEEALMGHDVALIIDGLYLEDGNSHLLTIYYGAHLRHADIFMLAGDLELDPEILVENEENVFAASCSDISQCDSFDWQEGLYTMSLDTELGAGSIGMVGTDALLSLDRMGREEMTGPQSFELTGTGSGYYVLVIHLRCTDTCLDQ